MTVRLRRSLALTVLVTFIGMTAPAARAAVQTPAKDQTATAFYHAYRAALAKAKSIDDLRPWIAKENLAKVEATPADQRPMIFSMMQSMALDMKNLKVLKETKTATGAELQLEATGGMGGDKPSKGTVAIVREAGAWKIGKESWTSGS
jgi:predicted membrane chloride channel (bestrophin family)